MKRDSVGMREIEGRGWERENQIDRERGSERNDWVAVTVVMEKSDSMAELLIICEVCTFVQELLSVNNETNGLRDNTHSSAKTW